MLTILNFKIYEMLLNTTSVLLVMSLLIIVVQNNPVQAVFSFVLTALITFFLLILLGAEFFALLVLIIYTGVITVLFLFVVIMYNLKGLVLNWRSFFNPLVVAGLYKGLWFQEHMLWWGHPILLKQLVYLEQTWFTLDVVLLIELFNEHFFLFLMCGLIIFIALLGSIVITYPFYTHPKKGL